jgi:hypothetical protein
MLESGFRLAGRDRGDLLLAGIRGANNAAIVGDRAIPVVRRGRCL